MTLELLLDADDARDIVVAIAHYQHTVRWTDGGGVLLPEGASNLPGAILGEICRDWLDYRARLAVETGRRRRVQKLFNRLGIH